MTGRECEPQKALQPRASRFGSSGGRRHDNGSIPFAAFNTYSGEGPRPVLWAVIVDRSAEVVLLYELLNSQKNSRRGVASNNGGNASLLAIFEPSPDAASSSLAKSMAPPAHSLTPGTAESASEGEGAGW